MRSFLLLWLTVGLTLAGCASKPIVMHRSAQADAPFAFNGRVAIKHEGERSTAGLRWEHQAATDSILLLAPLGQTVASLQRNAQGVTLEASGKQYFARDAEALTHQILGWELPLSGLRYWVTAVPAQGSTADVQRDANGQVTVLRQDGWEVSYSQYASSAPDSLPLRFVLQREHLEIRVIIDEWEK